MTGVYALLTHAQPFWVDVHKVLVGGNVFVGKGEKGLVGQVDLDPVAPETARAFCALVLAVLFSSRAVRSFGGAGELKKKVVVDPKTKTQ